MCMHLYTFFVAITYKMFNHIGCDVSHGLVQISVFRASVDLYRSTMAPSSRWPAQLVISITAL